MVVTITVTNQDSAHATYCIALKEQAQYDHSQSASKLALQRRQKAITNQKNQAERQKYKIVISTFIFL